MVSSFENSRNRFFFLSFLSIEGKPDFSNVFHQRTKVVYITRRIVIIIRKASSVPGITSSPSPLFPSSGWREGKIVARCLSTTKYNNIFKFVKINKQIKRWKLFSIVRLLLFLIENYIYRIHFHGISKIKQK